MVYEEIPGSAEGSRETRRGSMREAALIRGLLLGEMKPASPEPNSSILFPF